MFHWPYLRTETLQKIQAAAKERHLVLMAHANSVESWRSALDAHVDVIAHGLWIWPGDSANSALPAVATSLIADASRSHTRLQPTMQTVAGERAMVNPSLLDDPRLRFSLPAGVITYLRSTDGVKVRLTLLEQYKKASPAPGFEPLLSSGIERTRATFKIMVADHVPVILGTDTPGVDGFGNPPGLNGRLEMQDWADAGAPLSLILRAATLDNASALGLSHAVGSIEVGKRADLLLLGADPLKSIAAYDSIETVFLNGVPIAQNSLLPAN
jgi:imidazolonepropionase-like amidohydrolase